MLKVDVTEQEPIISYELISMGPKVKVCVLHPFQQPGSYWNRSSILCLLDSNPHNSVCLVKCKT